MRSKTTTGLYEAETGQVHYKDYEQVPGHVVVKAVRCRNFLNNCDVWMYLNVDNDQAEVIETCSSRPVEPRSQWQDIWDMFYMQNDRRSIHELKVWLEQKYNTPTER